MKHWKTRAEVAQAFIELTREQERRERKHDKKKKHYKQEKSPAGKVPVHGQDTLMASTDDGQSHGSGHKEPETMDDQA
jgi:hypothetical protein